MPMPKLAPQCSDRPRTAYSSAVTSLAAIERRVAHLEQDMHVQFIRIAQLQAQIDHALAARARSPYQGAHLLP